MPEKINNKTISENLVLYRKLHGIATMEETSGGWYFTAFVAVMFIVSYILVGKMSKKDKYIA